jgi:hypothetical protein
MDIPCSDQLLTMNDINMFLLLKEVYILLNRPLLDSALLKWFSSVTENKELNIPIDSNTLKEKAEQLN